MNFKRVAALLLAGAMVMTAVPVYAKGDDVTLSVSIWDTNQESGIKEILADFTEKTGIKTEISVVKWDEYWTMLEAGAQVVPFRTYSGCTPTRVRDTCPTICFLI